jgi:hypothetical protein
LTFFPLVISSFFPQCLLFKEFVECSGKSGKSEIKSDNQNGNGSAVSDGIYRSISQLFHMILRNTLFVCRKKSKVCKINWNSLKRRSCKQNPIE